LKEKEKLREYKRNGSRIQEEDECRSETIREVR